MTDFTTVKKNLESKRFRVSTFATAEEAADYLDRSIDGVSVGIGGSVTAEQMGLYEKLSGHNRVFWHWRPESAEDPRREAMTADMYITSVNGMAETGELINIDGNGNRVASSLYGHKKVWFIVGRNADLLLREKRSGIGRCVVLCAATTPGQVVPANDYAVTLQRDHPEVTAFGTLHPGYEAWESQLERLKAAGIRGLKLHPDFQHFWLDDPRLLPMFEAAQDDFIFLFHIGDSVPPEKNPSCPYKLAALLDRFPRLRCIAGHLGGYHQWEHSLKALVGRDVWLDTSSCTPFIQPDLLKAILRKHPQDRILFGSDYPLYDPGDAMMHLQEKAELGDADLDRYCSNAEALFA